jgi:hypothetical protein
MTQLVTIKDLVINLSNNKVIAYYVSGFDKTQGKCFIIGKEWRRNQDSDDWFLSVFDGEFSCNFKEVDEILRCDLPIQIKNGNKGTIDEHSIILVKGNREDYSYNFHGYGSCSKNNLGAFVTATEPGELFPFQDVVF